MHRVFAALAGACAAAGIAAAAAPAATRLYIRGAGDGHGVGMSQYGAYGYALHGRDYRFILGHYYTGTSLGRVNPGRIVRVILQANAGAPGFTGASSAGGRSLSPDRAFRVVRRAGHLVVVNASGRRVMSAGATLRVTGPGRLRVLGHALNGVSNGLYRGALEFRLGRAGGVNAIDALGVDDYVRGVVAGEVPASWPMEALKAQAVAARTYGIATNAGGVGFDQWPDTRSQVYRGVAGEEARATAAVRATRGQVVTYAGRPATTYFFSTSGGRTENIEFSFLGSPPEPYLKSVNDPYDGLSPLHRWGPYRLTMARAQARLGRLVRGRFRGVRVLRRGRSPRIVSALVLGSRGRTRVTGPELRARFGLHDTWAYFTVISSRGRAPAAPAGDRNSAGNRVPRRGRRRRSGRFVGGGSAPAGSTPGGVGGGTSPPRVASIGGRSLVGSIEPAPRGSTVSVERWTGARWRRVARARLDRHERYRARLGAEGIYRVRWRGLAGPDVRIR